MTSCPPPPRCVFTFPLSDLLRYEYDRLGVEFAVWDQVRNLTPTMSGLRELHWVGVFYEYRGACCQLVEVRGINER